MSREKNTKMIRNLWQMTILLLILLGISKFSYSQVSVNNDGSDANATSMLDVKSTNKGLLIPRMTTSQRNAISNPSNGLLVFDLTTHSFWYYENNQNDWVALTSGSSNSGSINDLSDAKVSFNSIYFGTNSGLNNTGSYNNTIGINSLHTNIAISSNTAIGTYSLFNIALGDNNIALGSKSLYNSDITENNTAIGYETGKGANNNSKIGNILLGYQAGYYSNGDDNKLFIESSNNPYPLIWGDFSDDTLSISGDLNVYGGFKISDGSPQTNAFLSTNDNGNVSWSDAANLNLEINDLYDGLTYVSTNTYLGYDCGRDPNSTNDANTAIGYRALDSLQGITNSAFGSEAMLNSLSASGNIAIGQGALSSVINGNSNIAIGYQAGYNCVSGSHNIFLGNKAGYHETGSNKLYIDNSETTTPLIYADYDSDDVIINGKLHLAEKFQIQNYPANFPVGVLSCEDTDGLIGFNGDLGAPFSFNDFYGVSTEDHSFYFEQNKPAGTSNNTLLGKNAMLYNTLGGTDNVALGMGALEYMQQGSRNVAIGVYAGQGNSTLHSKSGNVFIGYKAGYFEMGDDKLYIENSDSQTPLIGGDFSEDTLAIAGDLSVYGNLKITGSTPGAGKILTSDAAGNASWQTAESTVISIDDLSDANSGISNTFLANNSGENNSGAFNYNTALGINSLQNNTTGKYNSALGYSALNNNISGINNVAIGYQALADNLDSNNTAIGCRASYSQTNLKNTVAIGFSATNTNSNSVVIGNSSVNYIGGYQSWSSLSDKRFKKNIKNNVPGLDFILKLRPITYQLDLHKLNKHLGLDDKEIDGESINIKESIQYSGFIAQEVEQAAQAIAYDFSGLHSPENEIDHYTLSYSTFVVPLVKAVQEQEQYILKTNQNMDQLDAELLEIEALIKQLKKQDKD